MRRHVAISGITTEGSVDYAHRDRILRSYFLGKDWDENPEFRLKRELVLKAPDELARFPFLVDDEWEVSPGKTDKGRGDLLFTDGAGGFAVVEVKFIDNDRTGKTARTKRNDSRSKVVEQARRYAAELRDRLTEVVAATPFVYTNERGLEPV